MPVYTVHAPIAQDAELRALDRLVFVRDGFHVWAAVFGAFWLLWNRLWLAALGWIVLLVGLDLLLAQFGVGRTAILVTDLLLALLLGLEACSLKRWSYSRGKWRQFDIIAADDVEAAERRFFERWSERKGRSPFATTPVDRGAPPPTRDRPPPLPSGGIIGLFPEPGGNR